MVDYNLQVPGIAPAQSSQINPLQMLPMLQQQQLNNMLIQQRARELQELNALGQYMRDPKLDLTTQPGMLGALRVAPKAAPPIISAVATAMRERRQGEASQAQTAHIMQQIQAGVLKMGTDQFNDLRERLAVVDIDDPKSYAEWHRLAASKLPGVTLPSPKDWAAAPPEARRTIQQRLMTTAEAIRKNTEERLDTLGKTVEFGRKSLATIDPNDMEGYRQWFTVMGPYAKQLGYNLPSPDKWNAQAKTNLLTTIETFNEQLKEARARVPVTLKETRDGLVAVPNTMPPGATELPAAIVTEPGQSPQQQSLNRAAPFVDTNPLAGVPNVPVSAARRAEMEANTQKFGGLPQQNTLGSVPRNAFVAQSAQPGGPPPVQPGGPPPVQPGGPPPAQPGGPPPAQPGRPLMLPTEAEKAEGRKTGELAALEPQKVRERRLAAVQSRKLVSDQIATLEDAVEKVKALKNVPAVDKETILGYWGAYTPTVSAKSREVLNKYDNLKGVATAIGRFLSANEGKLGNMAVQEWQIVSDQLAALDRKVLSPTVLDNQLDIISKRVSGMIDRLKEGYKLEHEEAIKQDPRLSLQGSTAEPPPKTGGVIDWNDLAPGKR